MAERERIDQEERGQVSNSGIQHSPTTNQLFLKISIRFIWFLTGFLIFAVIAQLNQRQPKIDIPFIQTEPTRPEDLKVTFADKEPEITVSAESIAPVNRFQKIINSDPELKEKLADEMLDREFWIKKRIAKSAVTDFYNDEINRLQKELQFKRNNQLQIRNLCSGTAIPSNTTHITQQKMKYLLKDLYNRKGAKTIADFGCGKCEYVEELRELNFQAQGYEYTMENNAAFIKRIDLSQKADLGKKFDFVQSFEVGEHIYSVYEDTFIDNIVNHAKLGIVLSWSAVGQDGFMHVNSRDNEYVIQKVEERGFTYQPDEAYKFRKEYTSHFADTIMVFFKN